MTSDVAKVTLGLEACLADPPAVLRGKKFGVLVNQASVDARFRFAHHLLAECFPGQLAAMFTPQHGLWSEQQDNMVETPHGTEPQLGIPIHSLYAETRKPTPEMLRDIEVLVVDLQDVGTRVYTFIWTLSYCLEACAESGIPVLVLDRPNPLGGEVVEGPLLDPAFASFVGRAEIPMRHGLTIAEMALCLNRIMRIGAEMLVVPMPGWQRSMLWPDTQRAWVPPSPNLPRYEGALVYPGQVLLEGTQLSEGRGTTTPFELFGAPWLEPEVLMEAVGDLDGAVLRPLRFSPTFQKWAEDSCGGVFLHCTDPASYRPYATTLRLLSTIAELWPLKFRWQEPPYEYETEKMPIDILAGTADVRKALEARAGAVEIESLAWLDRESWWQRVRPHLLYEH